MFDIKEESMCSSEENSRKLLNNNSINSEENHSKLSLTAKYKLDRVKIFNNISYTLNNVNVDMNICPVIDRENISQLVNKNKNMNDINMNNFGIFYQNGFKNLYSQYSDLDNYKSHSSGKPKIKSNFIKDNINNEDNNEDEVIRKNSFQNNSIENHSIKLNPTNNNKTEKIQCNCKKSKCLKLYCECFANGENCQNCNCLDCHNLEEFEDERIETINIIKEKNPLAFHSKIDTLDSNIVKHSKGCNCSKSNCQKKYCECFQVGIECSDLCRCKDCKNNHHFTKENKNINIKTEEDFEINFNPEFENKRIKKKSLTQEFKDNGIQTNPIQYAPVFNKNNNINLGLNKKRNRKINNIKKVYGNGDANIMKIFNKINKNDNLPMTTPKKQNNLVTSLTSAKKNNTSSIKTRKYRDTTLSHIITTAPTSTKRRTNTKLNMMDFDKSIVKKLNMNVNNEPLFGNK